MKLKRLGAGALLAVLLGLPLSCSLTPDVRSRFGAPRSAADREDYVACRAQPPIARLAHDGPATLVELLQLVETGSVALQQVRAEVLRADAAVSGARASLLPNLTLDAGLLAYARAPGSLGFTTDRQVVAGTIDISVPLDVSGRLAEGVRAAQARYRSARHQELAQAREQRLLVTQAYFTLLEAIDLAQVNEAAVLLQERALKDGQARLDVGVLRKSDVLVIEVALSNSRQRAVALASAILDARRALNTATGLPIGCMTEIVPFDRVIPVLDDVVPLLDRARHDNPEVDVLVETRTALLHELRASTRADLPEVDLGPRVISTTDGAADPAQNFIGFVSVSWNPDLNGRIEAEKRGLKAQLLDVAWAVTGLLRKLEAQILRAHQSTIEKTSALTATEKSVGQARENLRIVLEQFRAGTATGREVLEAQSLLTQQEGTLKTARHAVNSAQFELWYDAGVDPLDYAQEVATGPASRPESR